MVSFNVAGYFFDTPHDFCTLFERLAVFVKIIATRSSYLFLQQTVINPIMSQNKAINENLRTLTLCKIRRD